MDRTKEMYLMCQGNERHAGIYETFAGQYCIDTKFLLTLQFQVGNKGSNAFCLRKGDISAFTLMP